jgi:hypothetical protein
LKDSTRDLVRGWFILAAIFLIVLWVWRKGIAVSVRNDETFAVRDVVVTTSAGDYPLGDLEPGDSASTTVGASGESSVAVSWIDAGGRRREHDADTYFEGRPDDTGSYAGTVDFTISAGAASDKTSVGMSLSPFSRATPPAARK